MIVAYSKKERQLLEAILSDFRAFIDQQKDFDILYSEKSGYMLVTFQHHRAESVMSLLSSRDMLNTLLNEMISFVLYSSKRPSDEDDHLAESDKERCRLFLRQLLTTKGAHASDIDYAAALESRICLFF